MEYVKLLKSSLSGRYAEFDNVDDAADCVIACSFGLQRGPRGESVPGLANSALAAEYVERFAELPAALQFEIYEALPASIRSRPDVLQIGMDGGPNRKYLTTRDVLVRARQLMEVHRWHRALLVGHRYHMARISYTAAGLGMDAVAATRMPAVWDRESTQIWTRRPELWGIREALVVTRDVVQYSALIRRARAERGGCTDSWK